MLTVAVIGADGSGKSTVTSRVVEHLDVPARRMYLGISAASATHPLPTTRRLHQARVATGRPLPATGPPEMDVDGPTHRTAKGQARALARLVNRITEEAYQETIRRWHRAQGRVVMCDRFYLADYHAHDLSDRPGRTWDRRLHGAFLRRCISPPDLVVLLTAPPDVLHARKREGSVDALARRQAEYSSYAETVADVVTLDATDPLDDVVARIVGAIGNRIGDHGNTSDHRSQPEPAR